MLSDFSCQRNGKEKKKVPFRRKGTMQQRMNTEKTGYICTHAFMWGSGGKEEKTYTTVNLFPVIMNISHMMGKMDQIPFYKQIHPIWFIPSITGYALVDDLYPVWMQERSFYLVFSSNF